MKQSLLIIAAIFLSTFCHAQLRKGTVLLEGSLGISASSSSDEFSLFGGLNNSEANNTFLLFSPRVGWFAKDNSLFGIGLTYEHNLNKVINTFNGFQDNEIISKRNLFLLNPYYTKYTAIADKLYLTTSINLAAGIGDESVDFGANEQSASLLEVRFNVVPGLTYFLSDKWALQASIGQLFYRFSRSKLDGDVLPDNPVNSSSDYGISFRANTFQLGFQYFLTKSSE